MRKYIILLILMVLSVGGLVYADETEETTEEIAEETPNDKDIAVVQVLYGYLFEDKSFDAWKSVPGIAVNNNTVLAVLKPYEPSDYAELIKERREGYEALGIDIDALSELKCMIYDGDDHLKAGSAEYTDDGYMIITVDEGLEKCSHFSSDSFTDVESCYAAGFPQSLMDLSHYADIDNILYFDISSEQIAGNTFECNTTDSLVCVYDQNYGILGLITDQNSGKYTVLDNKNIKESLTLRYITFTVKENISLDYSRLDKLIEQAETVPSDKYSKESYKKMKEELENAKKLKTAEDTDQSAISRIERSLSAAINGLKEEDTDILPIILVVVGLLLITAVTVWLFIKFVFKKPTANKKKPKKVPGTSKKRVEPIAEPPVQQPVQQRQYRTLLLPPPPKNDGGTMVLTAEVSVARLIRRRTGEVIYVEQFPFTIGRDETALYQINDNETVSNIHCYIVCMSGEYNVFDNNSTNGTYIDGYKIPEASSFPLQNGQLLMISNEIFEFRTD